MIGGAKVHATVQYRLWGDASDGTPPVVSTVQDVENAPPLLRALVVALNLRGFKKATAQWMRSYGAPVQVLSDSHGYYVRTEQTVTALMPGLSERLVLTSTKWFRTQDLPVFDNTEPIIQHLLGKADYQKLRSMAVGFVGRKPARLREREKDAEEWKRIQARAKKRGVW